MPSTKSADVNSVQYKVENIVWQQTGEDADYRQHITPGAAWKEIELDSLDLVEIVIAIEDAFSLVIPNSMYDKFKTVGDVTAYVESEVNARNTE
jgi:acyl carrier protein